MEISAPSEISYLKSVRSQLDLKKDKQLRLGRQQQPLSVQLHSDAICEVIFDEGIYRLLITTTTRDNYEYELEGAQK